jgi:hypothetical protein
MLRWLRRWPPAAWLAVYVGSLFIINGGRGDPPELVLGIVLCLAALAAGVYLAAGRWEGHPVPRGFYWAFGAVAALYLVSAAVAALYDPMWAAAAIAAGVVPLTAVTLLFAAARSKTVQRDGRMADVSAADENDPFPAVGMNNTPQPEEEAPADQVEPERREAPPRESRFARGNSRPARPGPARDKARRR